MNNKSTFIRLMKVLDKRLLLYLFVVLVSTISMTVYGVVSSYLLKDILEMAQLKDASKLPMKLAINVIIGVLAVLVWRWAIIIYNVEAKRGIANLEKMVFSKAVRLPMSYYEENHSADFISRMIFDTSKAGDIFGSRFRRLVAPTISVVVYFVPMMMLCWQLTLAMLLLSCVALLINSLFMKPMKKVGTVISKENASLFEKLTNLLAASDVIKIFDAGDKLSNDYKTINKQYTKNVNKQNTMSSTLQSLNYTLEVICTLLFLVIGVYYLDLGIVSIGEIAAVYAMYGAFNWHFLQLGRYMPEMTNCLANAKRVFEFIDQPGEKESFDIPAAKSDEYISIENLDFAYNEERQIFDDFSMHINKGECVALVGGSGRGKST
ncbi:MAG: ABC transporter ATP-binding protein, partial [Lachnospiraceae bacterium]|nr:ABC transporter ATP-binding protein [Lachnospiraceae bacterium]